MTGQRITLAYENVGDRYLFLSADDGTKFEGGDLLALCGEVVRFAQELKREGGYCDITAYDRLGAGLKMLRDAGVIVRYRLDELAPLARVMPPPRYIWRPRGRKPLPEPPAVMYWSWDDYLRCTSRAERMARCVGIAQTANRKGLTYETPALRLTKQHVMAVLEEARGRCVYCGSLAVEKRPTAVPWQLIGRRIASLEHVRPRWSGGDNDLSNLAWSCLWCNLYPAERIAGAADHGGFYPKDKGKSQVRAVAAPGPNLTPEQYKAIRECFWSEDVKYDAAGEAIGAWIWEPEEPLQVRGREIATYGAAVRLVLSLPPEERDAVIEEMRADVEEKWVEEREDLALYEWPYFRSGEAR